MRELWMPKLCELKDEQIHELWNYARDMAAECEVCHGIFHREELNPELVCGNCASDNSDNSDGNSDSE